MTDAARVAYLAGDYDVVEDVRPRSAPLSDGGRLFASSTSSRRAAPSGNELRIRRRTRRSTASSARAASCRAGEAEDATWEIGYWYGMPYWGLGYASEAARALMDWARDQLGAKVFVAGHFADNPASGNVLRKLGFVRTGSQDLFGLARQGTSPAERYVWPEGATPVSLTDHHGAHVPH